MHFWNNLHQVLKIDWKAKQFKVLGAIKPKGLNKTAKSSCGHICPRDENLSFISNYIIWELNFSNKYVS